MMTELEKYYNKFNEEKRLKSRHGQVEFITSMKYIHKYLPKREHGQVKILDVGAGTGRYSVALAEEGYDVTAVELVKYNLGILKKKNSSVKAYQGNALKLSRFPDKEFDLIILFGPMYHLYTKEDKVKALMEAKRVLKDEGTILVAYTMNTVFWCMDSGRTIYRNAWKMANWMRITGYVLHRKICMIMCVWRILTATMKQQEWNGSRLFRRMDHPIICVRC